MFNFIKLLLVLTVLLKFVTSTFIKNNVVPIENPCPSIFQYVNDGIKNYGQIKVSNIHSSNVNLVVKLSLPVKLSSYYLGEIRPLHQDLNVVYSEASRNGFILYNVIFPVYQPLPLITSITVNGNQICNGQPVTAPYVTTIILSHNIFFHSSPLSGNVFPAQSYGIQNPNVVQIPTESNVFGANLVNNIPVPVPPASSCVNEGFTTKRKLYVIIKGQKLHITEPTDHNLSSDASPVYELEQELKFTPLNGAGCI